MPNMLDLHDLPVVLLPTVLRELGALITNYSMTHNDMQSFLHSSDEHFDLIILEVFLNEAMLGFAHHFNVPMIGFSTFGASKWTTELVGTPNPMSYVPHPFLSFSDRMPFMKRLINVAFTWYDGFHFTKHLAMQSEIYERTFPRAGKPTLEALRKNVSLVLLNNHFTMNFPRPYAPNMIEIGGIHLNRNAPRPLPTDIKNFVEGARYGCVYFSMGSILKSSQLDEKMRDGILRAFSKLKERVLWKWEDADLPGRPDNVFISKWFPQDDLLAHPNVKLFITHGGLLSSTEAVYHGVPVIGIPMFGDQKMNMAVAVNGGYGLKLDYEDVTEATLTAALNEVLGNEK